MKATQLKELGAAAGKHPLFMTGMMVPWDSWRERWVIETGRYWGVRLLRGDSGKPRATKVLVVGTLEGTFIEGPSAFDTKEEAELVIDEYNRLLAQTSFPAL